jgi:glutathione synthase
MLASQERGHRVFHCLESDVSVIAGQTYAKVRPATMTDEVDPPIALGDPVDLALADVDAVIVRTDPPVDEEYIMLTLLLEPLRGKTVVVNDPRGLREANEKLYGCRFPELMPPTIVTADRPRLLAFAEEHAGAVLKPIDGHGGRGIQALMPGDPNRYAIVDTLTKRGRRQVMAQRFLPEVYEGDRRILLLDGEVLGAILRIPTGGDFRANIGVGGSVTHFELNDADRRIVDRIGPSLREDGLWFVGLDVIGEYLSEVNVTSPTGIRQLGRLTSTRPDHTVIEWLEVKVQTYP